MLVSSVLAARTSHGSGRLAATLELNIDRYLVFTVNRVEVFRARRCCTGTGSVSSTLRTINILGVIKKLFSFIILSYENTFSLI